MMNESVYSVPSTTAFAEITASPLETPLTFKWLSSIFSTVATPGVFELNVTFEQNNVANSRLIEPLTSTFFSTKSKLTDGVSVQKSTTTFCCDSSSHSLK